MSRPLVDVMGEMFTNYIGPGSEEKQTEPFRNEFPALIEKYNIKTVNDAGCGLGWIKDLCPEYKGFDILPREGMEVLDITCEVMPKADLIICRDVLFHLPTLLINRALENFKQSQSHYLLTTCCYDSENDLSDYELQNRPLNIRIDLTKKPWEWEAPLDKIEEPLDNRYLGLWKIQ